MRLSDYTYNLPTDRIAAHPLHERDQSRLLVYRKEDIQHKIFSSLPDELEKGLTLFFNNTKVIPARLFFKRDTGAVIEVFLLEPVLPSADIATAMSCRNDTTWKCLIGNLKKWKDGEILTLQLKGAGKSIRLSARIADRKNMLVNLIWDSEETFSELVELAGEMPLPPYIKREVSAEDRDRYQTVYRKSAGAVAAPTAGLHFTESVLARLKDRGIHTEFLTLHVSAGTFMPIKEDDVTRHKMHAEQVYVTRENIECIIRSPKIVAVGTTSMRTLESLYWYGVKLRHETDSEFVITQDYPYDKQDLPGRNEAMESILSFMDKSGRTTITGRTEIFIRPGYEFRVCNGLITNFHLPQSTLILLVAAFIGEDWRRVYTEALDNDYRFLSYGDSSLLLP